MGLGLELGLKDTVPDAVVHARRMRRYAQRQR